MTEQNGNSDDAEGPGAQDVAEGEKPTRSFQKGVVNSASGLLRDAVSARGTQVGTTLSQGLAAGGKEGSISSGPASASTSLQDASAYGFPSLPRGSASGYESFRSALKQSDPRPEVFDGMTLDQFLETDPDNTGILFEDAVGSGKGKQAVYPFVVSKPTSDNHDTQFAAVWESNANLENALADEARSTEDGAEVVRLLSDPNVQPDIWTGRDAQGEGSYTISQGEAQISQWFVQEVHRDSSQKGRIEHAVEAAREARPFGEFATIFDDIESYHEDVWGYIGPLVQAAREEHSAAPESSTGDGPAVRRLRMVMAHLNLSPEA